MTPAEGPTEEMSEKGRYLPLVTVITPVYNRESYLDETVQSVLSQDYPNLEYIVLDDGSTDNSREVLKKYRDRLLLDSHKNMGETRTVNKGLDMARGEIVGVVNSDDPLLPGAISRVVEVMTARKDVIVVYPDWNMIDSSGREIRNIRTYDFTGYPDMIRRHHCLPGPAAFFRREIVEKLQGRDPQFRYVGDLDFWFRAGLLGPLARIPETLATFRVHPGSASVSQQGRVMAEEHIRVVDKVYALPDLPYDILDVKEEAYSSAYYMAGCSCGRRAFTSKVNYFLKALRHAPLKYLGEYRGRLVMMILVLFGVSHVSADSFLRRFMRVAKD
jgi:glycosyltransferase involved in cell wall biosynthesis